jgi:hypothetical protein
VANLHPIITIEKLQMYKMLGRITQSAMGTCLTIRMKYCVVSRLASNKLPLGGPTYEVWYNQDVKWEYLNSKQACNIFI